MTVSMEPERDLIRAYERLTGMLLLEYQIIQHDKIFKFGEEFNMKRSNISKKKFRCRFLDPAEFEIYDALSYDDRRRYIEQYRSDNIENERKQCSEREKGYFKEFDKTQWEHLLNINSDARIRFITNGIPILFSNDDIWGMSSSKNQCIIVRKPYMSFYIKDCGGDLDDPRMTIFLWMLGHEMAHKQVDIGPKMFGKKRDHVREVYCDIRGVINAGLTSDDIDYIVAVLKDRYKSKPKKYTKSHCSHPSWEHRIKYMKAGKFDESVIREIAGYGEKAEKLIAYYKPHFISNAFAEAEKVRSYYDAQKNELATKEKSYHMYVDDNSYKRINLVP